MYMGNYTVWKYYGEVPQGSYWIVVGLEDLKVGDIFKFLGETDRTFKLVEDGVDEVVSKDYKFKSKIYGVIKKEEEVIKEGRREKGGLSYGRRLRT